MPSWQADRHKAVAYDQIAELAVTARIKALRAGLDAHADLHAILNDYFQQSIAVMRRCGIAIKQTDQATSYRDKKSRVE